MELIVNRASRKKIGTDCLLENMEISDHMIGETVRAHRSHGHHVSALTFEYRRFYNAAALILGDIFSLTAALFLTGSLRYAFLGEPLTHWWIEFIVPIWLIVAVGFKLYPGWGLRAVEELRRQTLSLGIVFSLSVILLFWLQMGTETSRFSMTVAFVLALFIVPGIRKVVKSLLIRSGQYGLPVVIYGAEQEGRDLVRHLDAEKGLGYKPIAFLDDHPSYWGASIKGIPVFGDTNLVLPEAQVAILAMNNVEPEYRQHLLEGPLSYYRNVIIIPDLRELPSLWVGTVDMGGTLGLKISMNLADPIARFTKRSFDLVSTILTSIFWVPLVGVIASLIWLGDRKNPFFLQTRVGHRGQEFKTWKFSTMVTNAEDVLADAMAADPELRAEWEKDFKLKKDPRITTLGHFLRKFSLDEIPQLINVFLGQMSLAGPRPLPAYHDDELEPRIRAMRRRVRSGITGMWQVSGRSDAGTHGMELFDSYYVRNWSIWLDIVILVRTISAVLRSSGAY